MGVSISHQAQTLQHWREAVLHRIIPPLLAIGALALITSSIDLIQSAQPYDFLTILARILFYTSVFIMVAFMVYQRKLKLALRAGIPLAALYTISIIELHFYWFGRDGMLLAFVAVALTTLLFGLYQGMGMLASTAIFLFVTAVAPWTPWLEFPFERTLSLSPTVMLDEMVLFVFLVIIVIIPTSYLLQSLEQSLSTTREHAHRAEEMAQRFAQQAHELTEKNRRLEHVERELRETIVQTERRLAHIQALQQIDHAITTNQDVYQTLEITLAQVTTQLQVDAAAVWLVNPIAQTLDYAAGRGLPETSSHEARAIDGMSCTAHVARQRRLLSTTIQQPLFSQTNRGVTNPDAGIACYGVPLIVRNEVKGVLEVFHRQPLTPESEWLNFLQVLAGQTAIAIDHAELMAELQRSNDELLLAYDATIAALARTLELRDAETEGHCRRVTELTVRLAEIMGFSEEERVRIRRGALLHDIGKVAIPDAILLKPGPLTDDEYAVMQQHTIYAYEMLAAVPFLQLALDIPYCHHEKWDGSGYPRGLRGEDIPLSARMFAIIDVYDALCSDRPYRKRWTEAQVRSYLAEQSGKHFDPAIVQIFLAQAI
ncbi:MAG: HD domain-containing protein [Chloroflexaceae bacterium]|nr:HD domain-containing protein [Chloroflexaceae bacterium]